MTLQSVSWLGSIFFIFHFCGQRKKINKFWENSPKSKIFQNSIIICDKKIPRVFSKKKYILKIQQIGETFGSKIDKLPRKIEIENS